MTLFKYIDNLHFFEYNFRKSVNPLEAILGLQLTIIISGFCSIWSTLGTLFWNVILKRMRRNRKDIDDSLVDGMPNDNSY